MNASPQGGSPAPGSASGVRPPRRRRLAVWLPVGVGLLIVVLIVSSGGLVLRPVPEVVVRPVLSAEAQAEPAEAASSDGPRPTTRTVQAPGWLEADPFFIACPALTDGVIESVLVLEGERVEAGQVVARLVQIDAELELARARADLAGAQAGLDAARADLAAARTEWDEPVERERSVAVAGAMADMIRAQLEQLPALLEAERAEASRTREELDRARQAFASGAANEIEVVLLERRLEAAEATARAVELREPILRADLERAEAEHAAARRQAELRTTERRTLDGAAAAVALAESLVAQRRVHVRAGELALERTEVKAPVSGFVQRRIKSPGDKVMVGMDDPASAQVLHLYDPSMLQVRVDVPLADASQVFAGQRCEVVVEVLPDRTFAGEVTRITHQADLQKNTLQIKVRVLDPDPMLRPEMLTRVRFLGSDDRADTPGVANGSGAAPAAPVLIPASAVIGGDTVYAVRERRSGRGVIASVVVEVNASGDETDTGWVRATGDLRPGDLVVVSGDAAPGRQVRPILEEEPR